MPLKSCGVSVPSVQFNQSSGIALTISRILSEVNICLNSISTSSSLSANGNNTWSFYLYKRNQCLFLPVSPGMVEIKGRPMIYQHSSLCHINILVFLMVRSTLVSKASSHTTCEAVFPST